MSQQLTKSGALWVHFLRAKYKCASEVPLTLPGRTGSHLRKDLGIVLQDVRNNITWSVGHGRDVGFWYDDWIIGLGPLIQYSFSRVGSLPRRVYVASMVHSNGVWNWDLLSSFVLQEVLLHIAAIKEPTTTLGEACINWKVASNNMFSLLSKTALITTASARCAMQTIGRGPNLWKPPEDSWVIDGSWSSHGGLASCGGVL
ncbi:hypothetical protein V6N13_024524 [Hibiscus sabdariffa]